MSAMEIEGTQYHRPNGTPEIVTGLIRDDLRSQWESLTAAGLRLEMEVLLNGIVSLTLTDPEREDYLIRVVQNADSRPRLAIEDMVESFSLSAYETWCEIWDRIDAEVADDPDAHDKPLPPLGPETRDEMLDRLAREAEEGFATDRLISRETRSETARETAETRNDDFMRSIDGY